MNTKMSETENSPLISTVFQLFLHGIEDLLTGNLFTAKLLILILRHSSLGALAAIENKHISYHTILLPSSHEGFYATSSKRVSIGVS